MCIMRIVLVTLQPISLTNSYSCNNIAVISIASTRSAQPTNLTKVPTPKLPTNYTERSAADKEDSDFLQCVPTNEITRELL